MWAKNKNHVSMKKKKKKICVEAKSEKYSGNRQISGFSFHTYANTKYEMSEKIFKVNWAKKIYLA